MSYYLRVLCKSDRPILRSEIINFIKEGAYFDAIPDFSAQFSDGGSDSPGRESWTSIMIPRGGRYGSLTMDQATC